MDYSRASYGWLICDSRNRSINTNMLSTCTKCSGHLFELSEQSPSGSSFKMYFVQCSKCGGPIGSMEYFSAGAKLTGLEGEVSQLKAQLRDVQSVLNNIQNLLQRRS